MQPYLNSAGQPLDVLVPDWTPRPLPPSTPMAGRTCRVEPLDALRHADDFASACAEDEDGSMWTYLASGPYSTVEEFHPFLARCVTEEDRHYHAVVDAATGRALGLAAYMRVHPEGGTIEVGCLTFAPPLQRTVLSTEAMYLMMRRVFDELGYRRYEWKCHALNAPSRVAALRLGFAFEGIFRQHWIAKGRNRDTAWYSILDSEWPTLRPAFESWLDPSNFDRSGRQRQPLAHWMEPSVARLSR